MKDKKFVIWDWNGTLLDDAYLGYQVFADICEIHDVPRPSFERYREIYQHPIQQMYREAGFDLEKILFERIVLDWHTLYMKGLPKMELHHDAISTLESLKEQKVVQCVLSALPHQLLLESIERNGVGGYFKTIQGLHDSLGVSKVDNGHQMIREFNADPSEVVLFGDSTHDYEVADALGIDCILFSRGYETPEKLSRHKVAVFESFEPILSQLKDAIA